MNTTVEKKQFHHLIHNVRFFLLPYLVILAGCLTIKTFYTREQIYFAVNGIHSDWADKLFVFATAVGDGLAVIALAVIIALFNYRKSFLLITSYGLTALVAQILKFMFDRPRPSLYFQAMHDKMRLVKGVYMLTIHSFPSGHTVSAFSAGVALTYVVKNKAWGLLFLICVMLIGYSRMYLSEHFFEDVTAGSAIGVFVTLIWIKWLDSKAFIHSKAWTRGLVK